MRVSSESGFNLIELVVAGTVFAGVSLAAFGALDQLFSVQNHVSLRSDSLSLKNNLYVMLENDNVWEETLKSSSMKCLKDGDCKSPINFDISDSEGNTFYNGSSQTSGFSKVGIPCNTYPSEACPIKANVTAQVFCGTCSPKQARIDVSFQHKSNKHNLARNDFMLIKSIPDNIIDCSSPFNLYDMTTPYPPQPLAVLGMPRRPTDGTNISRDISTQREICKIVGCGPPTNAAGRRFRSCKNNGLIMWNGTAFVRTGGCYNGGNHMYLLTCS